MYKNPVNGQLTSVIASSMDGAEPGRTLQKWKMYLWLALPLTLAVGCASGPNQSGVARYRAEPAGALTPPTYERQAADKAIRDQIFELFVADRGSVYAPSATVREGVVTLHGVMPGRSERQKLVDRIRVLPGVEQVKDERGDVAMTAPARLGP